MKKFGIFLLFLFFLLGSLAGFLQTPWAKEKAKILLIGALSKEGFEIEVAEVKGVVPSSLDLVAVRLETPAYRLTAENLRIRISLWRLLKKELSFTELVGSQIHFEQKEDAPRVERALQMQVRSFPFLLNIHHLRLNEVTFGQLAPFDLSGYIRMGKQGRFGFVDLYAKGSFETTLRLTASLQRNQTVEARAILDTKQIEEIVSWPFLNGALSLTAHAVGPLSAWLGEPKELKGELEGTFQPADGGELIEAPWTFATRFLRGADLSWKLYKTEAENRFFTSQLSAEIVEENKLKNFQASFISKPVSLQLFQGQIQGAITIRRDDAKLIGEANFYLPFLGFQEYKAKNFTGKVSGVWAEETLALETSGNGYFQEEVFEMQAQGFWKKGENPVCPTYTLALPTTRFSGHLKWLTQNSLFLGETKFETRSLESVFGLGLFGKTNGVVTWGFGERDGKVVQTAVIDFEGTELFWKKTFAEKGNLTATFYDPFHTLDGLISLSLEQARYEGIALDVLTLTTSKQGESWPFVLSGKGQWKDPLQFRLGGMWKPGFFELQGAEGVFFSHAIALQIPTTFTYGPENFVLEPVILRVDRAELFAEGFRNGDTSEATLTLRRFPLDFLSVNPLDVTVKGFVDGTTRFRQVKGDLSGNFAFRLDALDIVSVDDPRPSLKAAGRLEGSYAHNRCELKSRIQAQGKPLLSADLSVPFALHAWPFSIKPLFDEKLVGNLMLDGQIEDILDFFNLGTHRLEGRCKAEMRLSHTLGKPDLDGYLKLEEGHYQNYATGTEWTNVNASLLGEPRHLKLQSSHAQDGRKLGNIEASGGLFLDWEERFPFQLDLTFSQFRFLQINLVEAEGNGELHIKGNLDGALAQGNLNLIESDLIIPNKVPRSVPDLEVTYRNPIKPLAQPTSKTKTLYPLRLDLTVFAPNGVFISGRGLNSEWRGDFRLGGELDAVSTIGTLSLVQGEFTFSGRNFKIEEGALSFSGAPGEMPHLDLTARTDAKGVVIFAHLRGPLNNPQVTLTSNPPLPLSSVLSYLLFGQDLSEINSFQALQLVNSVASLAGEGPDVLEKSRRALGVDRLQIISIPATDDEEGETIAVQVGKYISEGVLVTFSQSAEDNGTNIGIEVELNHGFSFVIETQQQQEQGKFSLRWSLNY